MVGGARVTAVSLQPARKVLSCFQMSGGLVLRLPCGVRSITYMGESTEVDNEEIHRAPVLYCLSQTRVRRKAPLGHMFLSHLRESGHLSWE